MENASKALIMAGSLLISLLIIGALVFMYNQFVDVQQTKTDVDEEGKLGEYSKKFEDYNRVIYGSELLSLANLQEDYNKTQASEKGYTEVNIDVTTKGIVGTTYFSNKIKTINEIGADRKSIEIAISNSKQGTDVYNNLKSSYTEFKSKLFKCTQIKYDQNNGSDSKLQRYKVYGRLSDLSFSLQGDGVCNDRRG